MQCLAQNQSQAVALGIGDDAAIIDPEHIPAGQKIVIATDTLVAGRHFLEHENPADIGHKALAVNLSDMAAMCARPKWLLMNLTLPDINQKWLPGFQHGVGELLQKYQVELIGGDTTSGPLSIGFTVLGLSSQPKKRSDARDKDLIVVSGQLGSAAFALNNPGQCSDCDAQLKRPTPRFDVSEAVKGYARAMIDVSDGLLADLGHICESSDLGATIQLEKIPIHASIKADSAWRDHVLAGGDDYQLCFTIASKDKDKLPTDCAVIGHMESGEGVHVFENGQKLTVKRSGFDHFT